MPKDSLLAITKIFINRGNILLIIIINKEIWCTLTDSGCDDILGYFTNILLSTAL